MLAQRMQGLVAHDGEAPQEGVAPEVVDGGLAGAVLPAESWASSSIRCSTTAPPLYRRQAVRAWMPWMFGQHVRLVAHLAGVELQHSLLGLDQLSGLDREETRTPERTRRTPRRSRSGRSSITPPP